METERSAGRNETDGPCGPPRRSASPGTHRRSSMLEKVTVKTVGFDRTPIQRDQDPVLAEPVLGLTPEGKTSCVPRTVAERDRRGVLPVANATCPL